MNAKNHPTKKFFKNLEAKNEGDQNDFTSSGDDVTITDDDVMTTSDNVSDTSTSKMGARNRKPNSKQELGVMTPVPITVMEPATENSSSKGPKLALKS
jgi:hypothetical protein